MALSRFWTFILILSIGWAVAMLATGRSHSLGVLVNGSQGDPIVVAELDSVALSGTPLLGRLKAAEDGRVMLGDTLVTLDHGGIVRYNHGTQAADGLFETCKATVMDLWLPLIGYLTFFCGLMNLLVDSRAMEKLARFLSPIFKRIFPDLPAEHPAYGYMTLNFAANFLGLDNAATPFGLKAMESMQANNPSPARATNSQIMFLCLHAAGLTLLPTSIIGYRAAMGAANPSDIMIPMIVTSFIGTLAALLFVSIRQRINLLNLPVMLFVVGVSVVIGGLMVWISQLAGAAKVHFTDNLGNGMLLLIILLIVAYAYRHEKLFTAKGTNMFDSFIEGSKDGWTTGLRVLPYMIAMLCALSIFRNSGLMSIVMDGFSTVLAFFHVDREIIDAVPVALMRPFSAGGARGFMLDAMKTYGADSLTGQLSSILQGAAETTFYVIALYFGAVNVKDTRYTLGIMLLVDLVCVLAAIAVCVVYF